MKTERPVVKTKFKIGEQVYILMSLSKACGKCEHCGQNVEKEEYVVVKDNVGYVQVTIDLGQPARVWYGVGAGNTPADWIFKKSEKKKAKAECVRLNEKAAREREVK